MAKQSGLGAQLYVNGYDLSGDVGMIQRIQDKGALLPVTGIDKSAMERIHGIADGGLGFTSFFNDAAAAAHPVLSARGAGDKNVLFAIGSTIGKAGAVVVGKQVDYAGARGEDGSLGMTIEVESSDGQGLRWGEMLTAGKRTDTGATTGATVDSTAGAPTGFGAVLMLHVFSFSGTLATVKVQDSANGSAWADLSGGGFTAITAGPTSKRISLGSTATVRRYLRAVTTTSAGFTSLIFALCVARRYA